MRKCLYFKAILTLLFIFYINVNHGVHRNESQYVFAANVEALASGESGSTDQPMDCYSNVEKKNDGRPLQTQTYCGDCQPIKCSHWWNQGRCVR